jgi:hypothetical protein
MAAYSPGFLSAVFVVPKARSDTSIYDARAVEVAMESLERARPRLELGQVYGYWCPLAPLGSFKSAYDHARKLSRGHFSRASLEGLSLGGNTR